MIVLYRRNFKVDGNNYLWVISDRMPKFLLSSLNYSEPNFRVFFAPLDTLVKGTVCESDQTLDENTFWAQYFTNQLTYLPAKNQGGETAEVLLTRTGFTKAWPLYV